MAASTVALDDGRWFVLDDATCCQAHDGTLFQIAETWAVLDVMALFDHTPAKIISQAEALLWLTSRGFAIPDAMSELAAASRLRVGS